MLCCRRAHLPLLRAPSSGAARKRCHFAYGGMIKRSSTEHAKQVVFTTISLLGVSMRKRKRVAHESQVNSYLFFFSDGISHCVDTASGRHSASGAVFHGLHPPACLSQCISVSSASTGHASGDGVRREAGGGVDHPLERDRADASCLATLYQSFAPQSAT